MAETKTTAELPKVGARVQYTGTDGIARPADVLEHKGGTRLQLSVNMGNGHEVKESLHIGDKARDAKEHSSWEHI